MDQPFLLDLFVIPFQRGKEFAFASLSITFNYQGDELKKELGRQEYRLRWIICDAFQDEVNKKGKVPSPEKLKELILIAASKVLLAGRIKGVDINEFTVL
jgi:flagellar basal body-associated protein FliL